jgi:hypothetical protein
VEAAREVAQERAAREERPSVAAERLAVEPTRAQPARGLEARAPATTLSEALSGLDAQCFPSERYGTVSECEDGTTELVWDEPLSHSTHRLVFDENGRLIGRYHFGSAYSGLHSNVCLGSGYFDFFVYEAGVLPTRACETTCDICPTDGVGGAPPICGEGGQGG